MRSKEKKYNGKRVIRAEVIIKLLWGQNLPGDNCKFPRTLAVRLTGACIAGNLNLHDLTGLNDDFAPPLVLEHCHIPNKIDLSFAKVKNLSLIKSRITHLWGEGLQVEGNVDLTAVRSYEEVRIKERYCEDKDYIENTGADGEGLCHVELRGANIGGELNAPEARFCAPQKKMNYNPATGQPKYALDLRGSNIQGRFYFQPNGYANGGVSIQDCYISKDIWACDCELISQEGQGFKAQSLILKGSLMLKSGENKGSGNTRTIIKGSVSLQNAKIDGDVWFAGSEIKSNRQDAIMGQAMQVGGSLILNPSESSCEIYGGVWLLNSTVAGNVEMVDISIKTTGNNEETTAIELSHSKIGREIRISGSKENPLSAKTVINAEGLHVGQHMFLTGNSERKGYYNGKINLENATIDGNLEVHDAEFNSYLMYEGFYANDITVGGNIDFRPDLYYPAEFNRATVKGRFILGDDDKRSIHCYMGSQQEPKLSFRGAKIGDALKVRNFKVEKKIPGFYYEMTRQEWLLDDEIECINIRLKKNRRI